jgi:protein-disulfide isomerase
MSKSTKAIRDARRQQQKRQDQVRSIGMIIIGIVIILGAGIGLAYAGGQAYSLVDPPIREHPQANMNAVGDPNAPVVVENYSSFACGHCYNFFLESEYLLIQNYVSAGLVYYVYKPYHNARIPLANESYHAALCAGEQGAFWEMHDILYANFNGYTSRNIEDMAEYIGVDLDTFDSCMDSDKYYDQVILETQNVVTELEITGTPTFVVNGEVAVVGNEGYEALAQAINAALEAAQNE